MRRTLVALVLTVAIATPLAAQSSPDFGGVRRILREGMAREAAPAAAFAVVRDGVIIWEEAIGWADSVNNRPATPDSPFLLASLNKTFETTLAAVLQGRHRVDLDHPVNEYLRTTPPRTVEPSGSLPSSRQVERDAHRRELSSHQVQEGMRSANESTS
jgi:CubicO group peptidase (beta-lactamase class C family)